MFIGVYLSLVATSRDTRLRVAIRNVLKEDPRIFDELAIAGLQHRVHEKVEGILIKTANQDKLQGPFESPTPDQINEYVTEVVNEIRESKNAH